MFTTDNVSAVIICLSTSVAAVFSGTAVSSKSKQEYHSKNILPISPESKIELMLNANLARILKTTVGPHSSDWDDDTNDAEFLNVDHRLKPILKSISTEFDTFTLSTLRSNKEEPALPDDLPPNIDFRWVFIAGCVLCFLASIFRICYRYHRTITHRNLSPEERLRISVEATQALARILRDVHLDSRTNLLTGEEIRSPTRQVDDDELAPPSYAQAVSESALSLTVDEPPSYEEAMSMEARVGSCNDLNADGADSGCSSSVQSVPSTSVTALVLNNFPKEETV